MKKTVNIIITLNGDWRDKIETVMFIEGIPTEAAHISVYNNENDTTTICFNYVHEREVNTK